MEETHNCLVCGVEVEGIGKLDVPYHTECILKGWRLKKKTPRRRQVPDLFHGQAVASPVGTSTSQAAEAS